MLMVREQWIDLLKQALLVVLMILITHLIESSFDMGMSNEDL